LRESRMVVFTRNASADPAWRFFVSVKYPSWCNAVHLSNFSRDAFLVAAAELARLRSAAKQS